MSKKASINKRKRYLGGAIKRTEPSYAATKLKQVRFLDSMDTLDFGCGYGFDADHFGWDSYDPYYRPGIPKDEYRQIVCINVLNTLSRDLRHEAIEQIRGLLKEDARSNRSAAYLIVPRDLPVKGKLGMHHSLQNYVVLKGLDVIFEDSQICIYEFRKDSKYKDKTTEFLTPRDRRILRS